MIAKSDTERPIPITSMYGFVMIQTGLRGNVIVKGSCLTESSTFRKLIRALFFRRFLFLFNNELYNVSGLHA
jgi:hypothetical protein